MKKSTYLIIACVILFLVGCLYYFLKDEPLKPKEPVAVAKTESTKLSYVGNSITEEKDGKRLWELKAETIDIDSKTKNINFKNIKGIFYQDSGEKIEIVAPEAIMDSKTKEVVMIGNVQGMADDGTVFTAQEVRWSNLEQRFYGSGGVTFSQKDTVMTGDHIESDRNMSKIKVSGHANIVKGGSQK